MLDHMGCLPLHYAVQRRTKIARLNTENREAIAIVDKLLERFPAGASQLDVNGRAPLHLLHIAGAHPDIHKRVYEAWQGAALTKDRLGNFPLHYAASIPGNADVVTLLLQCEPRAAAGLNNKRMLPLHCALLAPVVNPSKVKRQQVLESLLNAYPAGVSMRERQVHADKEL